MSSLGRPFGGFRCTLKWSLRACFSYVGCNSGLFLPLRSCVQGGGRRGARWVFLLSLKARPFRVFRFRLGWKEREGWRSLARLFGSVRAPVVLVLLGSLPVLPSRVGSFWLFPLGSIVGSFRWLLSPIRIIAGGGLDLPGRFPTPSPGEPPRPTIIFPIFF